jgi:hypothetical protein
MVVNSLIELRPKIIVSQFCWNNCSMTCSFEIMMLLDDLTQIS